MGNIANIVRGGNSRAGRGEGREAVNLPQGLKQEYWRLKEGGGRREKGREREAGIDKGGRWKAVRAELTF